MYKPHFLRRRQRQWLVRGVATMGIIALAVFSFPFRPALAVQMTKMRDTLSTQTSNVVANHTIQFTVPTGVNASTDTISINLTGFTNGGSADYTDIDFAVDDDAVCDGTFTDKTLNNTPGAGVWGAAFASLVLTFTAPTDATTGEITAGRCVQVEIGTHALSGTTGDQRLSNPNDQATLVVELTSELGAIDDSGNLALDFVVDDSVNVTATVDATMSFTISDTAIGFGSLATGTGRWATADAAGVNAVQGNLPTEAHNMTVTTNAASGWAITYYGATLTSTGGTINVAGVDEDSDGTPNSEQFGISVSTDGNSTPATGYLRDTAADFTLVASTTTTLISENAPTNIETLSVSYLANIAGTTEAGAYSTDITYIATGVF